MARNGHSYDTALLLSVLLGMFGIDRFYLGYPAIGKSQLNFGVVILILFWQSTQSLLVKLLRKKATEYDNLIPSHYSSVIKDLNTIYCNF